MVQKMTELYQKCAQNRNPAEMIPLQKMIFLRNSRNQELNFFNNFYSLVVTQRKLIQHTTQ